MIKESVKLLAFHEGLTKFVKVFFLINYVVTFIFSHLDLVQESLYHYLLNTFLKLVLSYF